MNWKFWKKKSVPEPVKVYDFRRKRSYFEGPLKRLLISIPDIETGVEITTYGGGGGGGKDSGGGKIRAGGETIMTYGGGGGSGGYAKMKGKEDE